MKCYNAWVACSGVKGILLQKGGVFIYNGREWGRAALSFHLLKEAWCLLLPFHPFNTPNAWILKLAVIPSIFSLYLSLLSSILDSPPPSSSAPILDIHARHPQTYTGLQNPATVRGGNRFRDKVQVWRLPHQLPRGPRLHVQLSPQPHLHRLLLWESEWILPTHQRRQRNRHEVLRGDGLHQRPQERAGVPRGLEGGARHAASWCQVHPVYQLR